MALYRVRNNLRVSLWLPTRAGFRKLNARQTRLLDLVDVNSRRMRSRHQSGALTIVPATNPQTGKVSPALPKLHLGVGSRQTALPALPTITGSPGAATVDTAYTFTPTLGGGQGTKRVTLSRGPLPPGLSLSPTTGAITGTPTTAGTYPVTLRVSDNAGSATLEVTISVNAAP